MALEAYGLTNVGLVRKHNEDAILVDQGLGLFIVADGLGGHAAGEVASKIVIDEIARQIEASSTPEATLPTSLDGSLSMNGNRLRFAIQMSDAAIANNIVGHPERDSMGSTVVACLIEGRHVAMAHVGDSRAYRINGDGIRQMTKDHSWVADQVAIGMLTVEEARKHPLRNVITQALGNGCDLMVEVQEFDLADSEALLLCSDGLTGMVPDDQIFAVFSQASNLHNATVGLVSKAIENGGEDNVSVVLVKHGIP
jgi:protein phosphatase